MQRIVSNEILDSGLVSPQELQTSFDDLWRINRWFGGVSGTLQLLERVLARTGLRAPRVLDVGGGDARLAARLRDELGRRGVRSEFVVLDRNVSHLRVLATPADAVLRVAADALQPPFHDSSFDVVMCNLFLHHFSGPAAASLLRAMLAMAGGAVVVNDLDRRLFAYLLIRYATFLTRSPIARQDGAASVRQAYTPAEIAAMARETGAASFEVTRLPFLRTGLILWK
ncbi:MAG: methyltransferase domain-containing protein [Terriglobia bacterium]